MVGWLLATVCSGFTDTDTDTRFTYSVYGYSWLRFVIFSDGFGAGFSVVWFRVARRDTIREGGISGGAELRGWRGVRFTCWHWGTDDVRGSVYGMLGAGVPYTE